ncbi:MAG: hypothetical protein ACFE7R_06800 [Candidatus Hodarchaeota archaeon]
MWSVGESSYAKVEDEIFKAMIYQPSEDVFGACLIQQGNNPHDWWYPQEQLTKNVTVYNDDQQSLILDFKGKRTSQIEWFSNDTYNRFSNIGILLVGDVGLDYYNTDTSQPRALLIDIWLDTNPAINEVKHWQGVDDIENDYHSGFPVQTMAEVGKEYEFRCRLEPFIRESLNHWELELFELKMVQCYIEAKASRASIEVSRIIIGIP